MANINLHKMQRIRKTDAIANIFYDHTFLPGSTTAFHGLAGCSAQVSDSELSEGQGPFHCLWSGGSRLGSIAVLLWAETWHCALLFP